MTPIRIYKDNYADSTVISNRFIDEYMKGANDAQLKVYLYLLRIMGGGRPTSISDIADQFNHTEKDVLRALRYWEKQKLLTLDFDGEKNLVGIHLRDLTRPDAPEQTSLPILPGKRPESPANEDAQGFDPSGRASCRGTGPAAPSLQREAVSYEKPSYSADQLRQFKEQDNIAQLLYVAQMYVGRPLTAGDMKTILYFSDVLHFSDDLVDYLIQYCVERGKRDFRYMEKVAVNWAQMGITTPRQAQRAAAKYDKSVYSIMNGLGREGAPTAKELEYINRWTREYGFSLDIILEACERTVMATDKHRFEYAEGILGSWSQKGVHHRADIRRIDQIHQQQKNTQKTSPNRFNQFKQNSYDFEELEKQLLEN